MAIVNRTPRGRNDHPRTPRATTRALLFPCTRCLRHDDNNRGGVYQDIEEQTQTMPSVARAIPAYSTGLGLLALALLGVGLVIVASATAPLDHSLLEIPVWKSYAGRQLVFALLGMTTLLTTWKLTPYVLDRPRLRRALPMILLAAAVVLLVLVLIPALAEARRGSQRWLHLGPAWLGVGFQPSELTKLAMVLAMASLLGDRPVGPERFWKGFVPPAAVMGVCVALVGKEDFGTALILAATGAVLLVGAGCRWAHLGLAASLGTVVLCVLLVAEPYRMERLTAAGDIWDNVRGNDYQPVQSLTTIASGGWWGVGLGAGVQKRGYLPEGHTDFIFAVICEEMGALGGMMVMGLYAALLWIGLRIMLNAHNSFERLAALGITAYLTIQALLNIAVVTVVTPTTGVSLPLVSAGGSGVIITCLSIGLLAALGERGRLATGSVTNRSAPADPA